VRRVWIVTAWELGDMPTVQGTSSVGDQRASYTLYIAYGPHPAARDEILAAFRTKWGDGVPVADGIRFVDGPNEVIASDSPGSAWYLRVSDRALAETLQRP
jgi:hypothetical protein